MMQSNATLEFTTDLLIGLLLGSFVEYAVHRLMHMGKFMGPRHAKHHRGFESQGWWGEFTDYSPPGELIVWAGFLVSVPAGTGFAFGTIGYAAFAAYAHQVQHEKSPPSRSNPTRAGVGCSSTVSSRYCSGS
jgi:sterol desaturase/sphingolipid hydroxylase (fatty acid hydroxylase superfamily)